MAVAAASHMVACLPDKPAYTAHLANKAAYIAHMAAC
jgi:hypothetical protein